MTDQPTLRDRIADVLDECRTLIPSAQADAVLAVLPAPADRAALLAEVERLVRKEIRDCGYRQEDGCDFCNGVNTVLEKVRRLADEAQQPEEVPAPQPVVCQGFQWIGQSFATCDRCGQPAWDHAGEEVVAEWASAFLARRTVRPWKPGQADAIRAKWSRPTP
jgi:hypothetical protein